MIRIPKTQSQKRFIFSITSVGIIGYSYAKNEIGPLWNSEPYGKCFCGCAQHDFELYTEINPKWIKDFTIRLETLTLLRGKHKEKLFDSGLSNDFFQQEQSTKGKIKKWN